MLGRMPPRGDSWTAFGSHVIVGLLVVSVLLVGVLTWQAQRTARSHRVMAERVLRDFAALAAAEFVRRTTNDVGYYGYQPLMGAIREADRTGDGRLPESAALRARERTAGAAELARGFFRFEREKERLVLSEAPWSDSVRAELATLLRSSDAAEPQGFDVAIRVAEGWVHVFVYGATAGGDLVGFEVDLSALRARLAAAVEREPLLPPSLANGHVSNEWLYLRLDDPTGRPLFAMRSDAEGALSSELAAERRLRSEGNGILDGFVVRTAVDVTAAPQLVIGGLPGSRVPAFATLLVVTAGLLVMAMLLLRRERAIVRLRSDFVSRVSHELRTPLTQIRLFAETLLLGRTRSSEERQRALEAIDRESRRLTDMVENVLQFSRSERDQARVATRPYRVAPLVESVAQEIAQLAAPRAATIERHLESAATAHVDPDAVRQILLNLLDNALKYGPAGQTVEVGVCTQGDDVLMWVEDEGPGVPAGERDRIWRPFYRLGRDRDSGQAGTGIGLAVVKDLVARQRGRAWVAPSSCGARFVVAFPGAGSAADPEPAGDGRIAATPGGAA
jgi:signal transduction histidine kinase